MSITNKDQIVLSIPNKPEYVSVARLTVSAIANRMGFDIERIEDIKVAIAEACTNAMTHGKQDDNESFMVNFIIDKEKLTINVCDKGKGCITNQIKNPDFNHLNQEKEGGLGIFIIRSLMDEVQITSNNGCGTVISMTKYMGEDHQ